jgi:hypothetical protein
MHPVAIIHDGGAAISFCTRCNGSIRRRHWWSPPTWILARFHGPTYHVWVPTREA